ncbi:protein kinase [Hyphomicrobium sp. xq]|uniref:Protein kinase n=1 Tax=Hyphomicrobium album TaxID=2665159 RepID=A0A6I3KMY9_9HYPH|nr:serine/threonine-protein kinase [Hyphomicrobium album]MTD95107.1 protein kinase [Hyphomicrobium album]
MTNLIALPSGTELVGDYRIERVLGAGGFGVTYLADEIALARMVTIKEYFPSDIAARNGGIDAAPRSQDCAGDYRWGLDRFIEEAQTLAKFDHTNIVRVYRYFRANNTGYMVLHFEEGQSLKAWLKSLGRAPRQKELDAILGPLLDALELIHKADFLHRDIAPDNIIIRKSGDPVLIDFGSARGEIASHTKTVSALVKPGYSPYEQYAETSRQQGPWTDIYALAGTLYHAVTGKRPPDAPSRMVKDEHVPAREAALSSYRTNFLKAIDKALSLGVDARPQSIAAWRAELLAPDPVRTSWLGRAGDRGKNRNKEKEPEFAEPVSAAAPAPAPAAIAATVAVAPTVPVAPASATPPPPDAPGPKGGLLDFLEGLRKKPDGEGAPIIIAAASTPVAVPAPAAKVEPPPAVLKKKSQSKKPIPKERALVVVKSPGRARPRRLKGSRPSLLPIMFKLLVGVGVASAAVAMQDRFPQFESRGSATTTTGATSGITTGTTAPVQQQAQTPAPVIVTPIAEIDAHRGTVTRAAYTADGRRIVTTGADGTMKLWDANYRNLVRTIELDDGPATALALNGSRALTGHANGKVVLWDIDRAEKIASVQRNEANIWAVAFVGDGDRFATASHDWKVTLWDARQAAAPLQVLDGHENAVQALAYSPQQLLLASGSADKTVRLWSLDTLAMKRAYKGQRDFITSVGFSQNGKLLGAGALDGRIQIWSVLSSRRLRTLTGHRGRVADVAFAPSGEELASAGEDGTVRLWDLRRGRILRALTGHIGGATSVAFSPTGEQIASAGVDGRVRIWAVPPGQLARE